jgi:hypothetical protein
MSDGVPLRSSLFSVPAGQDITLLDKAAAFAGTMEWV